MTGLAATAIPEPHAAAPAHRVTSGTRATRARSAFGRRERKRARSHIAVRAHRVSPGAVTTPEARRPHAATATTAAELVRQTMLADFCNRRETRAHPLVTRILLTPPVARRDVASEKASRLPSRKPCPAAPCRPPARVHGCTEARINRTWAPRVARPEAGTAWSADPPRDRRRLPQPGRANGRTAV